MRSFSRLCIASLLLGALLLSGCNRTAPSGPNDIQSGSLDEVTRRSEASAVNGGRDHILDMGLMAMDGFPQADIPLIRNAQTIAIWFYPSKSPNNRTIRDGFWAHHVVRDFSWGVDEAMHERALTLNALSGMTIDPEGNLRIDPTKVPQGLPLTVPRAPTPTSIDGNPKLLPHSGSLDAETETNTRIRVIDGDQGSVLYDSQSPAQLAGQLNQLNSQIQEQLTGDNNQVDPDALREFMNSIEQQSQPAGAAE